MTESPGPGWFLGRNGNWELPSWEYTSITQTGQDLGTVIHLAWEDANKRGRQGWEMVGATMHTQEYRNFKEKKNYVEFYVACFFKRPAVTGGLG
jgi:hypothetical protein